MNCMKRLVLAYLALVGVAIASPGLADVEPPSGNSRLITLDDYDGLRSAYAPQFSPDGQQLIYVIDGQVFLLARESFAATPIPSAKSIGGSRWSADGESIYFLSSHDDGSQIYNQKTGSSDEPKQIARFAKGLSVLHLSPDETQVLLSASDNQLVETPEDADPQPIVVTRRHFKRDAGNGYIVDGDENHLYVYDIADQKMRQITSGRFDEGNAAWSPDGQSIVFVSNREDEPDAGHRTDLWVVASNSPKMDVPLVRLTNDDRPKYSPRFSPDGERIAYLAASDGVYGTYQIVVLPAGGGDSRILTSQLDRFVVSFEFSDDGEWIYFNYYDSGSVNLARVRVSDASIEKLLDGDQVVWSFDVSASGDLVVAANQQNDAGDIYRVRDKKMIQLTDLNREFFDEINLGRKIKTSFQNGDGERIDVFITTPPDYEVGRAYPAILYVHGGPQDQFQWGFNFNTQFYASNGYVVLEPNPRGSIGRGEDFVRAIYRAWGVVDFDDVIGAVDYAVAQGIADPDRLAVTGYSYGGYMTNVVITRTDRFKAAASGAGHSLIEANFGHDMYQRWYMWELGAPWENREKYDVHSPLLQVGNVTTPTLFLGGDIDWNVPLANAEMFYQSLKVKGVDSQLVIYPGMHHGGWPASFEKDYLRRVISWFDQYVKSD